MPAPRSDRPGTENACPAPDPPASLLVGKIGTPEPSSSLAAMTMAMPLTTVLKMPSGLWLDCVLQPHLLRHHPQQEIDIEMLAQQQHELTLGERRQ